MIRNKENRRILKDIGKRWYDFDLKKEKTIYNYVCCFRINRIGYSKLDEELKFVSYHQWNQYVRNKYKAFKKDELVEFSRYLNQGIRTTKPYNEYWGILVSVMMTLATTKLLDAFLSMNFKGIPFGGIIFLLPFFMIIIMAFLVFVVKHTLRPMLDNHMEENFFKDYKEIIDELIKNKEDFTGLQH